MGGSGGVACRVGRALVLLGAVLLLVGDVLRFVGYVIPTFPEVLADVRLWGLEGALSGERDSIKAYILLGEVLTDAYPLCAAALALLWLRRGRVSALGPLAVHILGFSLACIRDCSPTRAWWFPMTLGVVALLAGAALLAERHPGGGSVPSRYGRAAGDVATLGLAFVSGIYLYTVCTAVCYEFYASGMTKLAVQVGHVVDRTWVVLRLAHFLAASALALLVGLERPGPGGEAGWRGRMTLRAAECAALVALMLRGIAEHYRYYGFLPRVQQVTICLCVLCLVGAALERVGARLDGDVGRRMVGNDSDGAGGRAESGSPGNAGADESGA